MSYYDGIKRVSLLSRLKSFVPFLQFIFIFAFIVYFFYSWNFTQTTSQMKSQIAQTQHTMNTFEESFRNGDFSKVGDVQTVQKELDQVKKTMQDQMEQFRLVMERADEARSRRAVERAKLAVLKGQVSVVKQKLSSLKSELASWTARYGSLMSGDQGRRIVGSETHLRLLRGILAQERPNDTQVTEWQLILDQLAPLIEAGDKDPDALIIITPEHKEMIANAETWVNKSLAEFEQQNLLVNAILKETASIQIAKSTLGDLLKSEDERKNRELTMKLEGVLNEVEEEAKADRIRRVSEHRKDVLEAETLALEKEERAKKAKVELMAKLNADKAIEETKVAEAEARAAMVRSREKATEIDAASARKTLEAEFQRDKKLIEQYLVTFTSEGYSMRQGKEKGPASLAFLIREGALKSGRPGLEAIMLLVVKDNERPKGPIPLYIGGDFAWSMVDKKPAEKAYELLNKYGTLMVEKGLLSE